MDNQKPIQVTLACSNCGKKVEIQGAGPDGLDGKLYSPTACPVCNTGFNLKEFAEAFAAQELADALQKGFAGIPGVTFKRSR